MFFCTSCSGIRWSWTIHTTLENETKPRKHVATDCLDVSSEPMLDRLRHTTAYAQGKYTDTTNVVLYWKVSASFRWLSGASWSIQRHTNKLKTAWMVCEFNYIEYENHETQVTITSIWELCRQKQVSPEVWLITSRSLLWDVITYPCLRYLHLATKSSDLPRKYIPPVSQNQSDACRIGPTPA